MPSPQPRDGGVGQNHGGEPDRPHVSDQGGGTCYEGAGPGRIVNIASVAGLAPTGSSIAYAVSKAGLIHLTRCMVVALAPETLVNCVAPGLLEGTRAPPTHKLARQLRSALPSNTLRYPKSPTAPPVCRKTTRSFFPIPPLRTRSIRPDIAFPE